MDNKIKTYDAFAKVSKLMTDIFDLDVSDKEIEGVV